jgi:hypothetical protein
MSCAATLAGFGIAADKALVRAEQAERQHLMLKEEVQREQVSSWDTVKRKMVENRFSIVAVTWGASIWFAL